MCQTFSWWHLLYMVNALCIVLKVSCVYSIEQQVHCHVSSADVEKHSQLQSSVPACLGWQSLQAKLCSSWGVAVCWCHPQLPQNSHWGAQCWWHLWGQGWAGRICLTLIVTPLPLVVACFHSSSATSRTISLISKKHALPAAAVDS